MSDQMALLPAPASEPADTEPADTSPGPAGVSWDLDDHTRELGRRGLAAARQALRQASAGLAA